MHPTLVCTIPDSSSGQAEAVVPYVTEVLKRISFARLYVMGLTANSDARQLGRFGNLAVRIIVRCRTGIQESVGKLEELRFNTMCLNMVLLI